MKSSLRLPISKSFNLCKALGRCGALMALMCLFNLPLSGETSPKKSYSFQDFLYSFQFAAYGSYTLPINRSESYYDSFMGFGTQVLYDLPIPFSDNCYIQHVGVSANFEYGVTQNLISRFDKWDMTNVFGGAWVDLPLISGFTVRPELFYGMSCNTVNSSIHYDDSNDHKYYNQMLRPKLLVIFDPGFANNVNLSFTGGVSYTLFLDKVMSDNFKNLDISIGVLYKLGTRGAQYEED